MGLSLTARLDESELVRLLGELLPLTIDLSAADEPQATGQRWLRIERPHHIDFEPGRGLRLKTSAKIRWTAVGLGVPATLNEIELLVRPVIASDELGPKLVFRPTIESADFKLMPSFVDSAITARINAALVAEGDRLAWHFGETLRQTIPLPRELDPADAFLIEAAQGEVSVEEHALSLRIDLGLRFTRRAAPQAPVV